ncbi:MAG: hypothetical protein ABL891_15220 [Burkholderiales bacterium]
MAEEFQEIGHSGGKITFTIVTDEHGKRTYQVGFSSSRPVPMVLIQIYATWDGVPFANGSFSGIGGSSDTPPPGGLPVMIACDSEGEFGHNCPRCKLYWRSGPYPNSCPYCALRAPDYKFLSAAQLRYVQRYCEVLSNALESEHDSEVLIDMDEVADAIGKDGEKPAFYVSEKSQQRKFKCTACDEFNDILGRFGYCSSCGTRNDLQDFELITIPDIRSRLNSGHSPEDGVRDGVASFDSFTSQIAAELARRVPMSKHRKDRLERKPFHELKEIRQIFGQWFDINICEGVKDNECVALERMFYRRHVYEHNGGEVDQKYLDNSGDTSVVLKQRIHETLEGAHELLGSLVKMARNMHNGFQELFPPLEGPIEAFREK